MTTTTSSFADRIKRDRFGGVIWRGHLRPVGTLALKDPRKNYRSTYEMRTTDGGTLSEIQVTRDDADRAWEVRLYGDAVETFPTKSEAQNAARDLADVPRW